MEKEARIQSVARALTIIDTLAQAGGELALNEIAGRLGLAKTTVHGLISTLRTFGYIEQSAFNGKCRFPLKRGRRSSGSKGFHAIPAIPSPILAGSRQSSQRSAFEEALQRHGPNARVAFVPFGRYTVLDV